MYSRVECESLRSRILDPYEVVEKYIPKTGIIAFAGMAGTSLPKEVPKALHDYISKTGEKFSLVVFQAGSTTPEFDEWISSVTMVMRIPFGGSSRKLREAVNTRKFGLFDMGLYEHSRWVRKGIYLRSIGRIDVAIIEAAGITREGYIIPSLSVDVVPAFIESCNKLIVEVNLLRPNLTGLHDIYLPATGQPIPISRVLDRIGHPFIKCPESKIEAIVLSKSEDATPLYSGITQTDLRIAENILDFLNYEFSRDPNLKDEYTVFQPGAGPMSSALARKISELPTSLNIWAEALSTTWIPLALSGIVKGVSSSVLYTLPGEAEYRSKLYEEIEEVKKCVVLRPYEVTNNPEIISRFNTVSIQQAIEIDVYGHVNVSHIRGNMYGGVGGSIEFTRSAYLTILAMPSTTGDLKTPRIVPIISHVDIPEHDVDVIVTENGWIDLRGLPPVERAKAIIDKCSHPKFKDLLYRYLEKAKRQGGHEPIDFEAAIEFWNDVKDIAAQY
ncbi:MAG: acetyl-CoA hydrolase/transferase C-terminal domain-containing protein [Candidatus Methanomethylicia archaeon]